MIINLNLLVQFLNVHTNIHGSESFWSILFDDFLKWLKISLKFDLDRHIIFSRVEVLVRELVNSRVTGDEFTSHELRGNTAS